MGARGIERVALEVTDLEQAMQMFSQLLGTTFRRRTLELGEGNRVELSFSPLGIELLEEVPATGTERLRSFHIRVDDATAMRTKVLATGGDIVSEFRVGDMAHLVTHIGPFRIVFVSYPGEIGMDALFPPTVSVD